MPIEVIAMPSTEWDLSVDLCTVPSTDYKVVVTINMFYISGRYHCYDRHQPSIILI